MAIPAWREFADPQLARPAFSDIVGFARARINVHDQFICIDFRAKTLDTIQRRRSNRRGEALAKPFLPICTRRIVEGTAKGEEISHDIRTGEMRREILAKSILRIALSTRIIDDL